MDVLPSCSSAAGLLGCTSTHAFVYLTRVLQETCMKVEECTDNDVLLSLTLTRHDGRNGVLLFASGYVDGGEPRDVSEQAEAQISVAVDGMVSALQELSREQRSAVRDGPPMEGVELPPSVHEQHRGAGGACEAEGSGTGDTEMGDGGSSAFDPTPAPDAAGRTDDAGGSLPASPCAPSTPGSEGAVDNFSSIATRSSPRTSPPPSPPVAGYILDKDFRVPGLTVPPDRILLPTGRGAARREPPPVPKGDAVLIDDALVRETVAELSVIGRHESLRNRLVEFSALYKFVINTLVERKKPDGAPAARVSHNYPQLTPEALRGVCIQFNYEGSKQVVDKAMFNNSHDTKLPSTLAVILYMKLKKNAFFLWLLGLFSSGALAPPELKPADGRSASGKSRKRTRASSLPPAGPEGRHAPSSTGDAARQPGGPRAALAAHGVAPHAAAAAADGGAAGPNDGRDESGGSRALCAVVEDLCARFLISEGRVVATAALHPEWSEFHGHPVPLSVMPGFIVDVADGCGGVIYPFGQDANLCLEKGNPAAEPVPLSDIHKSYKIAWPIDLIGPRSRLFDRPPSETGAVFLGTGCVWRAADPTVPSLTAGASLGQDLRADIVNNMPAVELFAVTCAVGKDGADYPFTAAFYDSVPYRRYKKLHFDDLLPGTMGEAVRASGSPDRSVLLWDPRYISA